ncbi:tRNA (cytidine(34)-2'-O)-methyltransferase [Oribacterium sinus]|jgi:tRNA methylase spoU|uniref:tRNA (cytidine(34)-2'-O)-methyltransferase n=1 Tax=Oribacterium sinus TaxID=237576 RepID=UPI0028EB0496|nr:tRNA (cytidine(34)-2'-O)-methyltransferase [Oribacterium sinus]
MNIVLHEPEIPFNTGAIGRTCVATKSTLHLIKPYGFILNDKNIKKAGMDYWSLLKLREYISYEEFIKGVEEEKREMETAIGEASLLHSDLFASENISSNNAPSETMSAKNASGKKIALPKVWYATTKAHKTHTEVSFSPNDYIVFGKESAGIPEEILVDNEEQCIRIPMLEEARSLNLSNSVAIILYEALRQQDFPFLSKEGALHHLQWKD